MRTRFTFKTVIILFLMILLISCSKESKGEDDQILSSKKIKVYTTEIKNTIRNWITLLDSAKYREFICEYHTPYVVKLLRETKSFDDTIEDLRSYGLNEFIMSLEDLLQEEPIINQNIITFNNSDIKLCKKKGKWYHYFDVDSYKIKKQQLNRQALIEDLNAFEEQTYSFYIIPTTYDGGGDSWTSNVDNIYAWLDPEYNSAIKKLSTINGSFTLSINGDFLTIVGLGTEIGNDGSNNVEVTMTIEGTTSDIKTTINN